MDIHANLQAQGLTLPPAPKPAGSYVPAVQSGNLVFVAGQLPFDNGVVAVKGHLGNDCSLEDAQQGARLCVLNALAVLGAHLGGDFTRIERVVRVGGFVACTPDFTQHPAVINGASDLLVALLGEAGKHARAAVGVAALPLGAAVEIEFLVQVRS
jgi:enamine deaminase RidA (YjgF/YER057c/UK114 family)